MTTVPPAGYYRQLLPARLSHLRIAHAHTPIRNATIHYTYGEPVAKLLDGIADPHSAFYAAGLRDGSLLVISPDSPTERHYAPGELFFGS